MEIERKYLISSLPDDLDSYDHYDIEQAYLNNAPVVRIRRTPKKCELTYKGSGLMAHEEYNLPLTNEAFEHLMTKADGKTIQKTRYLIPLPPYTIELDIFYGDQAGLQLAEVEFPSLEEANAFVPPAWFAEDVTMDPKYHNSHMVYGE